MDVKRLKELTEELENIKEAMRAQTVSGVRRFLAVRFFEIVDVIERNERHVNVK